MKIKFNHLALSWWRINTTTVQVRVVMTQASTRWWMTGSRHRRVCTVITTRTTGLNPGDQAQRRVVPVHDILNLEPRVISKLQVNRMAVKAMGLKAFTKIQMHFWREGMHRQPFIIIKAQGTLTREVILSATARKIFECRKKVPLESNLIRTQINQETKSKK
jgi:hypothetical protein